MKYVTPNRLYLQLIILTLLLNLHASLCSANSEPEVETLIASNTAFALQLYTQLKEQESGNLFFSPYSLSVALALTYAGARHNTARQMAQVLHFSPNHLNNIHTSFAKLQQQMSQVQQNNEIHIANALWGEKTYPFLNSFRELAVKNYQAQLNQTDFKNTYRTAHRQINAWVKKETQQKITQLIKPGIIDRLTRLVLVNAIYFKGQWVNPFDPNKTKPVSFWTTPHDPVMVPMMTQKNQFGYSENQHVQLLELPYVSNPPDEESLEFSFAPYHLTMVILLPRTNDGLTQLENTLTKANLDQWLAQIRWQKVNVSLPKFKINIGFELSKTLATMGMSEAFTTKANFSGINGTKALQLKSVVHQAFVDINEEGTEAAASSGIVATTRGIQSATPVFLANHPFLFLIRHQASGSILFLGRLMKPIMNTNQ